MRWCRQTAHPHQRRVAAAREAQRAGGAALLALKAAGLHDLRQNPAKLGGQAPELQAVLAAAGAKQLDKMHFSAVADGLADWLRPPVRKPAGNARSLPRHLQKPQAEQEEGRSAIVLAGCEAHVCLMQTALELLQEEFEVWVVTDD